MEKCFVLAGLLLNLVGVVLLSFAIKIETPSLGISKRPNLEPYVKIGAVKARKGLLYPGLILAGLGLLLQMVGTY